MPITRLQVQNFRNLCDVEIDPSPGINVICGDNGSGKTSLLEAIHCLALGRSFRTSIMARLVQHGTSKFNLYAETAGNDEKFNKIGMERHLTGQSRIRIDENDVQTIAELASLLPLLIINSLSHQLFEGGPSTRRKFMDWGVFYHDDKFLSSWRFFERVVRQRNILLKNKSLKNEIDAWTNDLVNYGYGIHFCRKKYIQGFLPMLQVLTDNLLNLPQIEANYVQGWPGPESEYRETLERVYFDELRQGSTLCGPHRADLELALNDVLMKHFLSRGQQKLMICGMIIAQGQMYSTTATKGLIYLIDDLPAELDMESRRRLMTLLANQPSQVFITAIDSEIITEIALSLMQPLKVFHVKQGRVMES